MGLKKALKWVGKKINQAATWVNDKIIQPVLKTVKRTVTAFLKDPLPYMAQIVGQYFGIPPYVTSAAITAMRGGDIKDIAKSAAITYIATKTIPYVAETYFADAAGAAGDFTASMADKYGISPSTAATIGNATATGVTNAAVSGMSAILAGKDVSDAMANGFVQGSVSYTSNSYFKDIKNQENWGITPSTAKQISGLTSASVTAFVTGQDPVKAMANYIASSTLKTADTEIKKNAFAAFDTVKYYSEKSQESKQKFDTTKTEFDEQKAEYDKGQAEFEAQQAAYNEKRAAYDREVAAFQSKADAYSADAAKLNQELEPYQTTYKKNADEYAKQQAIYDNTANSIEVRNAAAEKMDAYAAEMQKSVDSINTFLPRTNDLLARNEELSKLSEQITNGVGKELEAVSSTTKATFDEFSKIAAATQEKYDELNSVAEETKANYDAQEKAVQEANAADAAYQKQVADVATRDALVDAVNSGILKTVDNPDAPPGSITLENGMVITADGKYLQDGKELFSAATGVDQGKLDFKTETGEHYIFDNTGQRLTSETDAVKLAENEFGIKLDEKEAAKFVGVPYGTLDPLKEAAEAKVEEQLKEFGYKAPSKEMVDSFIQKGGDTLGFVEKFIDPYHVAADEVNEYYKAVLGREATPEEIELHVGAKAEADVFNERQAQELERMRILQEVFGESSGPIYAETSKGLDIPVPSGYRIASIDDVNNKDKTGAIFDPGLNAWLMPSEPSLSPVNVTAQNESYLQDFFGDYYRRPTDPNRTLDEVTVIGKREEEPPWEEGFPVSEDPSLDPVTVIGKREEDPLVDLPYSPITPRPPIPNVTVPDAKAPTPTVPKPTAPKRPASDALIYAMMGGTSAPTTQQEAPVTPVVEQSRIFDMSQPLDIGFFNQPTGTTTTQEEPGVVKIASGGYMDILFPKQGMSMDEILRILEGTHHG